MIYNNCYILKTRNKKSSTSSGRGGKQPIAGLSVIPVETVDVLLDPDGNILGYKQRVGAWKKEYSKDEIILFSVDKRPGMILGTPPLEYVKDDIIALRKIEENVELLIDRSIFPLLHAKVGTKESPATILPDGTKEIDNVSYSLETIDKTGGLVTNERVEIKAIGAESLALRVESYLNYFKTRVLIGLGVSSLDLGETDSSGKNNGEVLSLNIVDNVEFYQKTVETIINKIIIELLLDDNYIQQPYLIKEQDAVIFAFNSATQDKDVKIGSHYADLYNKGVVTLNEARKKANHKPLLKEQEKEMYHKRTSNNEGNQQKESGLAANIASPKNQHNTPNKIKKDNFNIPKELLSEDNTNYIKYKIISIVEDKNLGLEYEDILLICNNVIDKLLSNITLSYKDIIDEEVTRYILE